MNDTNYRVFYLDGNLRTAVWTSSPAQYKLAIPQGGHGRAKDMILNWGTDNAFRARPAEDTYEF